MLRHSRKIRTNKMKVLALFLVGFMCLVVRAEEEVYSSKFDNFDIDKVLQSERLLNNYHRCLLDEGPCTPAGSELKSK